MTQVGILIAAIAGMTHQLTGVAAAAPDGEAPPARFYGSMGMGALDVLHQRGFNPALQVSFGHPLARRLRLVESLLLDYQSPESSDGIISAQQSLSLTLSGEYLYRELYFRVGAGLSVRSRREYTIGATSVTDTYSPVLSAELGWLPLGGQGWNLGFGLNVRATRSDTSNPERVASGILILVRLRILD